jgi:hypothetical protein
MKPTLLLLSAILAAGVLAGAIPQGRAADPSPAAAADPSPAPAAPAPPTPAWIAKLEQIADIATVILDGDDCMTIVTDRAEQYVHVQDPRDQFRGSDNYDVNFEPFRRNKKLLIRLSRLADFPVDCNLWLRTKAKPEMVHMVIRQVNSWSRYWDFGEMARNPSDHMKEALAGKRVTIPADRGNLVAVLTPVRDSLGDVVGFVEVCAPKPD